jgi:hypothetical protein
MVCDLVTVEHGGQLGEDYRMRILAILLMLNVGTAEAAASMTMLWKARGLEALERLETSIATTPNSPERYRNLLEGAFALHATGKTPAHHSDDRGDAFHLFLNGGGDTGLFELVYIFSLDGSPIGTRVDSIPKGWSILFMSENDAALSALMERRREARGISVNLPPNPLVVSTKHCTLVFDLNEPFNPFVFELAMDGPELERNTGSVDQQKKAPPSPQRPAKGKMNDRKSQRKP